MKYLFFGKHPYHSDGRHENFCKIPFGIGFRIHKLKYDENNYEYFYAEMVSDDQRKREFYKYRVGSQCKIENKYVVPAWVPDWSDFSVIANIFLFVSPSAGAQRYYFNMTEGSVMKYTLPFLPCEVNSPPAQGVQEDIFVSKRSSSSYIVSQVCSHETTLNISHVGLELEHVEPFESIDFSKFRIPLLIVSFGIIMFVTMRNKKGKDPESTASSEKLAMDLSHMGFGAKPADSRVRGPVGGEMSVVEKKMFMEMRKKSD